MAIVRRTRVDDRDHATAAHEIGVGAEEGIGTRIVGHDCGEPRRDFFGYSVVDVNIAIEGELSRHGPELKVFWRTALDLSR